MTYSRGSNYYFFVSYIVKRILLFLTSGFTFLNLFNRFLLLHLFCQVSIFFFFCLLLIDSEVIELINWLISDAIELILIEDWDNVTSLAIKSAFSLSGITTCEGVHIKDICFSLTLTFFRYVVQIRSLSKDLKLM